MNKRWTPILAAFAAALAAGCGGSVSTHDVTRNDSALRGGTLHVGLTGWASHEQRNSVPGSHNRYFYALDPQEIRYSPAFELFRCCLLRTLLSYNGRPTGEGGTELRPDLAASLPTISADGLTWTFQLKRGLHYAPPLERTEIVAEDVIRALERELSPAPAAYRALYPNPVLGHYADLYEGVIAGATAFADGEAGNISGLEAPDRYTLVVHLLRPTGDLGYALSMPATAPIPQSPRDPSAMLGIAEGHSNGYGRFLVSSGPYMLAGSPRLDFSLPPAKQGPVSGYVPGRSFTFVRNPSWDPSSDSLRKAYADRIEFTLLPPASDEVAEVRLERQLDAGKLDLVLDAPASDARLAQPLKGRLFSTAVDDIYYFALNVALAPFDDVHVRRAANLVLDKERARRLLGNPLRERVATHLAPDGLEENLLLDFDPFETPGHHGDLAAARAEIARSRYDRNHDGICDVAACRGVAAIPLFWPPPPPDRLFAAELQRLGITLRFLKLDPAHYSRVYPSPGAKTGVVSHGFDKEFPSAAAFFASFSGARAPGGNTSLVGLSRAKLRRFGYVTRSVPSVEAKLDQCEALFGEAQTACWAELDELLMEKVVPWVPFLSDVNTFATSKRVANFDFDQLTNLPALDRIELRKRR